MCVYVHLHIRILKLIPPSPLQQSNNNNNIYWAASPTPNHSKYAHIFRMHQNLCIHDDDMRGDKICEFSSHILTVSRDVSIFLHGISLYPYVCTCVCYCFVCFFLFWKENFVFPTFSFFFCIIL